MIKKLLAVAIGAGVLSLASMVAASSEPTKFIISDSATLGGHNINCAAGGGCTIYDVPGLGTEIDMGNGESYLLFDDGTLEGAP